MKHLFLLLSVVFVTCVAGHAVITFPKATEKEAAGESYQSRKQLENGTPESVAYHVGNAGLKTLRNLMLEHTNVIISPVNIHHCLSILSVGAAGETKDELLSVLGPKNLNQSITTLMNSTNGVTYASALFLDDGFVPKPEFVQSVLEEFNSSVVNVNVSNGEEAKNMINRWVSDHTNGTINNVLEGLVNPQARMIVVSTLVFKGKWLQSFSPERTTPGKFYVDKDTTVDVELMNLEAVVPVVRNPFFEAIGLPYQDKGMMMYLILPKGEGSTMLKQVLSHLNMNSLKKLKAMSTDMESFIAIPKLKINGRYSLTQPLKQIGISAMFNPSTSNFTDISSEGSQLFVSEIYHSVHFELNEEGTLASAASASVVTKSGKFIFAAIRPFIIIIANEEDVILFLGAVLNP